MGEQSMTNSRDKGARFEREIANALKEYGYDARRTAQYCGNTGDASDVVGLPGFHIECKHQEKMHLYDWMEQAVRDSATTVETPIVIHKQNRKDTLVTMRFEDFMDVIKKASK